MDIVLIAGMWLDATAWEHVVPELEKQGHRPEALTLPGQGDDNTTATYADQVAAVVAAVDAADGPALVVGHSAACALEVVQGKADVFIFDQISVYQFWQKNPDTTRPILNPIREETWAIGMRKEDAALKGKVNQFLADFRERGQFEALSDQYMSEAKAAFQEMGVPFIFH